VGVSNNDPTSGSNRGLDLLKDNIAENMTGMLAEQLAANPDSVNQPGTFDLVGKAPGIQ